jgi:HD-GYP domain-containing protein (c-di-GMP phosphodiesterase class II)
MTSDRPYRKALANSIAMAELRKGRGTQFDPGAVDAFLAALEAQEEAARAAATAERPAVSMEPISEQRAVS